MSQAIGIVISLFFLAAGFVAGAWLLTLRLTPDPKQGRIHRWLLFWSVKALLLPVALWATLNAGVSRYLQPFMPAVQAARNRGGPWLSEYLVALAGGIF